MRVAPGGWPIALACLALAVLGALVHWLAAAGLAAGGLATLAFFRDPERSPPTAGVVAPADGRVTVLRTEADRVRVGVFMNVWNVHVVRSPAPGTVADLEHLPGGHVPAFSKDSDRNERVTLSLERPGDRPLEVTLIAGAVARRIRPYVSPGDAVDRGERIGHIAFGSRVDVRFPPAVSIEDLAVSRGDRVTAGETVLLG